MNRARYDRIKALFIAAREAPPAARAKLLEEACESDATLREEVESLLREDGAIAEGAPSSSGGSLPEAGAALPLAPGETRMIGSYRLLDVIGEGGMGIVYRAEQRKPRRAVALKVVRPGLASREGLERFEREAEVLGRLHHPGIAQIYEAATADTGSGPQPFFVMELIDGETLTRYAEARALSTDERLALFLKVCDAVEHAHEKGVVHRDLKPANILVDEYGAPKVLDFGVARSADIETAHRSGTRPGQMIGTLPYMSPEQVGADPRHVDSLTDVYSLGVICYELLSGRLPFDVEGLALPEAVRIIAERTPKPLGNVDGAFRGEIETIVARALEKDRILRYASVAAFAAAVRRYLEDSSAGEATLDGPPLTNIPFSRNRFFTGRGATLAALRAAFDEEPDRRGPRMQALSGLGGIGKTQTAAEYAYRFAADYDAVLWVRAESRDEVVSSFCEIARAVELSSRDDRDSSVVVAAVRTWLRTHPGWLLVLDNIEDSAVLEGFLPESGDGHVLLTSRAQVFRSLGIPKPLVLDPLKPAESREFLFASTDADADDEREVRAADELAEELGHLPLALEQAAALIAENHASLRDYLEAYRAQPASLLGEGRPRDYEHPVSTTWDMSFAAVERISGAAADVLRLSAFLSPDAIPLELVSRGAAECGERVAAALDGVSDNPLLVHRTLEPLTRFSLVHLDPGSRSFTVHRLVQSVIADRMDTTERTRWADRAVRVVNAAFPGFYPDNEQFENWALCGQLLPHARAVTSDPDEYELNLEQVGDVMEKMSAYLIIGGQFAAAEEVTRRCLGFRLRSCDPEDRRVGRCIHGLALAAHHQLQYGSARSLYKRAIHVWEKACGPTDRQVTVGLQNLALLCRQQGEHSVAKRLYTQVLNILEGDLGPRHHLVAGVLNNLAILHLEQHRYELAHRLLQRALVIRREQFGPEHFALAVVFHNLAVLFIEQGKLAEAAPLLERAREIRERTFGGLHHETAITLAVMAKLSHRQNNHDAAVTLYRRAIEILQGTIGPKHYHCARIFEMYSDLLIDIGQPTEAQRFAARAQTIRLIQKIPLQENAILL